MVGERRQNAGSAEFACHDEIGLRVLHKELYGDEVVWFVSDRNRHFGRRLNHSSRFQGHPRGFLWFVPVQLERPVVDCEGTRD